MSSENYIFWVMLYGMYRIEAEVVGTQKFRRNIMCFQAGLENKLPDDHLLEFCPEICIKVPELESHKSGGILRIPVCGVSSDNGNV